MQIWSLFKICLGQKGHIWNTIFQYVCCNIWSLATERWYCSFLFLVILSKIHFRNKIYNYGDKLIQMYWWNMIFQQVCSATSGLGQQSMMNVVWYKFYDWISIRFVANYLVIFVWFVWQLKYNHISFIGEIYGANQVKLVQLLFLTN